MVGGYCGASVRGDQGGDAAVGLRFYHVGGSPFEAAVVVDGRSAFGEQQGQSFADFYVAAQGIYINDDKTVGGRRHCNVRFVLSDGAAGDRACGRWGSLDYRQFSDRFSCRAHALFGHLRHPTGYCHRRNLLPLEILQDFGRRIRALLVALIEIQPGIEFGLTGKQLLQTLLMFEGAVRLCLVFETLSVEVVVVW